jgi:hypothetical protein
MGLSPLYVPNEYIGLTLDADGPDGLQLHISAEFFKVRARHDCV